MSNVRQLEQTATNSTSVHLPISDTGQRRGSRSSTATLGDHFSTGMRLRLKRYEDTLVSGFGFGLEIQDRGSPPVLQVRALSKGCEAEKSGLIRPGDIILKVNNLDVSRCTFDEALQTLASTPVGAYASFIVRTEFGLVTKLVSTFEEDGTTRTVRITQNEQRKQSTVDKLLQNSSTHTTSKMVHNNQAKLATISNQCATCQKVISVPNGDIPGHVTPQSTNLQLSQAAVTTQRRGSTTGLKPIKLRNVSSNQVMFDVLHHSSKQAVSCNETVCLGSLMKQTKEHITHMANNQQPHHPTINVDSAISGNGRSKEQLLTEAYQFMEHYYASVKRLHTPAHRDRLREIESEVHERGTYDLRQTELIFGAKLAWRNAPRCIGRIQWSKLQVFDARSCTTARDMFDAICNDIKYATNRGNLRSAITIFPQRVNGREDFRIWNQQLISYAGYANEESDTTDSVNASDESKCPVMGDPINVEFTKICQKLGWKGTGSRWDILPIVVSVPGEDPQLFPLPEELVMRVPIVHPKYEWFEKLDLQWYGLPAVSSMKFDVGGIEFPACPFSGWYMDTEVAVRDLADPHRYNVLPLVAKHMGLDINSNTSLWKDRAAVEMTTAVLYSYQKANITIVDHYTAAESFMKHLENENRLRGGCPADWVWIVPPISGSLTPVFHQEMLNYELKPAYKYQDPAWKTHVWKNGNLDTHRNSVGGTPRKLRFKEIAKAVKFTSNLFGKALSKRIKATILYATETGRSELFAKRLGQIFSHAFNVSVSCMDQYDTLHLEHETLLLIVSSTFGNGDPPENGESMAKQLQAIRMTGEMAPDLDRESISVPVTYLRYSSLEQQDLQSGTSGNTSKLDAYNKSKEQLSIDERKSNSVGPSSPNFATMDDNFAFADHVGPLSNISNTALSKQMLPPMIQEPQHEHEHEHEQKTKQHKPKPHEHRTSTNSATRANRSDSARDSNDHVRVLSRFSGRFGVFALGSSAYPNFCAYGLYLDSVLAELGGERIIKLGMGDELCGQEQSFNEWATEVFHQACDVFCLTDDLDMSEVMKRATLKPLLWTKENVRLEEKHGVTELKDLQQTKRIEQALSKLSNNKKVLHYKLLDREFLHEKNQGEENLRQTIRVVLQTDFGEDNDEVSDDVRCSAYYLPGDHLAVYPENEHTLVSAIIDRLLAVNGEQSPIAADRPYLVKIRSQASLDHSNNILLNGLSEKDEQSWSLHERLPAPVSLREALTRYLDITTPPTQQFLRLLANTAENTKDAEQIKHLAIDSASYETWKARYYPNLLEVLTKFSSVKPSLEMIFTQLPLLQPRYYSISSSPLSNSAIQLDLTVAVVQYTTASGAPHNGVCSNFLKNTPIGGNVYGFIRSAANFRLPKERDVPIIMVGPGTGIAPFRAFWQHRLKLKELNPSAEYGDMKLFFGCRFPSMQLYRQEIEEMIKAGIIDEYHVAYSRKIGRPKKYVQDNMRQTSKTIYKSLMEQNGHIYVCGDVSMAQDVNTTLKLILSENGVQDTEFAIYNLKESMRYHEDIFGITLRTAEVTNRGRTDALVKRTLSNT